MKIFNLSTVSINLIILYRVHLQARWGGIGDKNFSGAGMYFDLLARKADLAMCTVRPDIQLHARFDHTIQYMQVLDQTTKRNTF